MEFNGKSIAGKSRIRIPETRKTIAYARVSSHDQKEDLERQKKVLELYCTSQGWQFEILSDLGSGMNYQKKGLKKLINEILSEQIGRLVLTHKDRLLRFGAELIFSICAAKEVEVVLINKSDNSSFEEYLAKDVLEIITVFSARLYGSRSKKNQYDSGLKPNEMTLRRQLNAIKKEQFPWMYEVTKNAPQTAIINLGEAFKRFFKGIAKYPQFKKKGIHDSFTLTNDQFKVNENKIQLPHVGKIKLCETLRFVGKIISATISRTANKWFVSITVETNTLQTTYENQGVVGVDLGVKSLATLSNGEEIVGPKPHKSLLKRLKRLSRSLSRKLKGSENRFKAKQKLAKLHARIANIRLDALHKLTTSIVKRFTTVVIEALNVKGMMKNRKLSRAISDMGFYEFRRQLEYKLKFRDGKLIVADRFFASSKLCSACSFKYEGLLLSERNWTCTACSTFHQRDLNASINLKNLAVSSTVAACGEVGNGIISSNMINVKPLQRSKNQTMNLVLTDCKI